MPTIPRRSGPAWDFSRRSGQDSLGQIALDHLAEGGVDISRVQRAQGSTTTGLTIILQRTGWRNLLTYSGTIAELSMQDLAFDYLSDSRHFHLSSLYLQQALRPDVGELFRRLKAAGLTISLDTNDDPQDLCDGGRKGVLKYVDVLLPNAREATRITGTDDPEVAIQQLAEIVPLVGVKLGHEGALAQSGKERFTGPSLNGTAVDAVGAGDSFDAAFLHQYLQGSDLPTCLASGNRAGALSVTRPGGTEAFRDKHYREGFLRDHAATPAK